MRALFFLIVAVAIAAGLSGCQSSAPGTRPAAGPPPLLENGAGNRAELSAQEVTDATRLYTAKCAKCHKFYNPADYGDAEWDAWMKKMARKSKLKPNQYSLLSRYLETFRPKGSGERTPLPNSPWGR